MKRKFIININEVLLYFELIILIWLSGTVISAVQPDSITYNIARVIFFIIASYFAIKAISTKRKCFDCAAIFCVIFTFYFFINLLLYPSSWFNLLYRCIMFILLLLDFDFWCRKQLNWKEAFYRVVIVIAIISLSFYFIVNIVKIPLVYTTIIGDSNVPYRNYYGLYFFYGNPNKLVRLSGLFWEPGVYQIYLNLALFYYILSAKRKPIELALILMNIILTFSSTGMAITCILLAYMFVSSNKMSMRNKLIISLPVLITALIAIWQVVGEKIELTSASGSFYIRSLDFQLGLKLFKENFFLGTGFLNTDVFKSLNTYNLTGPKGSSNGFITWCYTTGILGITFALYPFFRRCLSIKGKKAKIDYIAYAVLLLSFNNAEPIYQLPIMIFLLAREYSSILLNVGE